MILENGEFVIQDPVTVKFAPGEMVRLKGIMFVVSETKEDMIILKPKILMCQNEKCKKRFVQRYRVEKRYCSLHCNWADFQRQKRRKAKESNEATARISG